MRRAGIREARQNLSTLIEEVKKSREILITDRGKPVARLVPPHSEGGEPFASRRSFRSKMPMLNPALSAGILKEREDRI